MMRVALDTAILVRGHAAATGLAKELVATIPKAGARLIVSPYILGEVERVLRYPRLQALYGMTDVDIARYINVLQSIADAVDVTEGPPIVLRDPNDDPIVYAAWAGMQTFCAPSTSTSTIQTSYRSVPVIGFG